MYSLPARQYFQLQREHERLTNIKQDVAINYQKNCPARRSLHIHEPIQSETIMAAGFLEAFAQTSIQTREAVQEKSEAKVGETEMDEGREDCAAW
jgi:hypothetical protein